jgi:hypothetical protein
LPWRQYWPQGKCVQPPRVTPGTPFSNGRHTSSGTEGNSKGVAAFYLGQWYAPMAGKTTIGSDQPTNGASDGHLSMCQKYLFGGAAARLVTALLLVPISTTSYGQVPAIPNCKSICTAGRSGTLPEEDKEYKRCARAGACPPIPGPGSPIRPTEPPTPPDSVCRGWPLQRCD